MTDLTIEQAKAGDVLIVAPKGRIDSTTAKELETAVIGAIAGGETRVVLDLGGVDYISSAGLRVVLMAGKRAKAAAGTLVLCALQSQIREVFEISGFMRLFTVTATRAEAVNAA